MVKNAHTPNPNFYGYLLVRTDMPSLGPGKGYAHGMHAGNHLTWNYVVEPLMAGKKPDEDLMDWHRSANGFGVTLALGRGNELSGDRIREIVDAATELGYIADLVVDPTYPYYVDAEVMPLISEKTHTLPPVRSGAGFMCFREELTTAYVMGDKAELSVLLDKYGLAPNE